MFNPHTARKTTKTVQYQKSVKSGKSSELFKAHVKSRNDLINSFAALGPKSKELMAKMDIGLKTFSRANFD
jgi:hypothetical protein